jgi:DNA-binding transcriptional MerR regulator
MTNTTSDICGSHDGARIVGIIPSALQRYARLGVVPSERIGGHRVYRRKDLEIFAAAYRTFKRRDHSATQPN